MPSTNPVRALMRRASDSASHQASPMAAIANPTASARTRPSATKKKMTTTRGAANSVAPVTTLRAIESLIAYSKGESDGRRFTLEGGFGFGQSGVDGDNGADTGDA